MTESGTIADAGPIDHEGVHPIANTTNHSRKCDIVFVHGIGGSSHSTWTNNSRFFWPKEIGSENKDYGIWTVGYPGGFTYLGEPGTLISQRAGNIAYSLSLAGLGVRPIFFIAHSWGGLLIKDLVVRSQNLADPDRVKIANAVLGIVFCGTPHQGSDYATVAQKLFGRGAQGHLVEMQAGAIPLNILHDEFIEWQRRTKVAIASFAEDRALLASRRFGRVVNLGIVVNRASANPHIQGCNVKDIGADHLELVKPKDKTSLVYAGVKRFLEDVLQNATVDKQITNNDLRILLTLECIDTNEDPSVIRASAISDFQYETIPGRNEPSIIDRLSKLQMLRLVEPVGGGSEYRLSDFGRAKLRELRIEPGSYIAILEKAICHLGDRGGAVRLLQSRLGLDSDGIFGKSTKRAVQKFQEFHDLKQDGIVGLQTWRALLALNNGVEGNANARAAEVQTIENLHNNAPINKSVKRDSLLSIESCSVQGLPVKDKALSHVEAFLGVDPIAGDDAIVPLAKGGSASLLDLLGRSSTPQHYLRLRKLCALLGQEALVPLTQAIQHGDWTSKTSAAPCFAVFKGNPEAHANIYNLLKIRDFDVQRLAIEAAGYLGYSSDIRWELARLAKYDDLHQDRLSISDYSFGKLSSYVIEPLGRGFAQSGQESELDHIRKFFDLCKSENLNHNVESALAAGLKDLTPKASDALIADWLSRNEGPWAQIALGALARSGLRRTISPVASCLHHANAEVRVAAGICISEIGSEGAAKEASSALAAGAPIDGTMWAVSSLCWRNIDWPEPDKFVKIAQDGSEVAGQMLVSLAIRDHSAATNLAQRHLIHADPFIRGTSAIALAYSEPNIAARELNGLADETASDLERVLIIAAEILSGRRERGAALHMSLQSFDLWPNLRSFWRWHVLAALRIAEGTPRGAVLWAEISQDHNPRVNALVGEFIDRATR